MQVRYGGRKFEGTKGMERAISTILKCLFGYQGVPLVIGSLLNLHGFFEENFSFLASHRARHIALSATAIASKMAVIPSSSLYSPNLYCNVLYTSSHPGLYPKSRFDAVHPNNYFGSINTSVIWNSLIQRRRKSITSPESEHQTYL
jgi:hypothetical protein